MEPIAGDNSAVWIAPGGQILATPTEIRAKELPVVSGDASAVWLGWEVWAVDGSLLEFGFVSTPAAAIAAVAPAPAGGLALTHAPAISTTVVASAPLPLAAVALDHGVHFDVSVAAIVPAPSAALAVAHLQPVNAVIAVGAPGPDIAAALLHIQPVNASVAIIAPPPAAGLAISHIAPVTVGFAPLAPAPIAALPLSHARGARIAAGAPAPNAAMALFHDWAAALDPALLHRFYRLVLTGAANGVADAILPMTSFNARARLVGLTYLSAVVPYTPELAEAVADRPNGDLVILIGARWAGNELTTELLRAGLEALPDHDIGPQRGSITLTGHYNEPRRPAQTRQIAGVTYRRLGTPRQLRTPVVDFWLRPGDTAVDPASGLAITANLISYTVGSSPTMTVSEGAD